MTTQEKKSFLKVIKEQIARYDQYIERAEYYNGTVGSCPICEHFITDPENKVWYSPRTSCLECPNLVYRIYNDGRKHKNGFSCSYRKTYPPRIRELFTEDQLTNYQSEGEKAAKEYWEKMYKFVKRTVLSQIDFGENSMFTMHMVWLDKTIAAKWEGLIKESIKKMP